MDITAVHQQVQVIRAHAKIPIAVGFGVRHAEHAQAIGACADGVIIGSRLIEIIGGAWGGHPVDGDLTATLKAVREWMAPIKRALMRNKT